MALLIVEELHNAKEAAIGKQQPEISQDKNLHLSIETYEKAMRNSCQGSTR